MTDPRQTAREIVAPLRQGLGPVILHRSVLADLVDWTERRIAAALTRDAVAVLHQIVTVCDDNRTATYPELALKFVRDVAAEALAAAPSPLGASSMLDWKLSDDTKECLREIDHNSAMAAANAGSFLVGAAPPPAAEQVVDANKVMPPPLDPGCATQKRDPAEAVSAFEVMRDHFAPPPAAERAEPEVQDICGQSLGRSMIAFLDQYEGPHYANRKLTEEERGFAENLLSALWLVMPHKWNSASPPTAQPEGGIMSDTYVVNLWKRIEELTRERDEARAAQPEVTDFMVSRACDAYLATDGTLAEAMRAALETVGARK